MLTATQEIPSELPGMPSTTQPLLPMDTRLALIDRLIKIEALEHKMGIGKAGSAFDDDDGEEE